MTEFVHVYNEGNGIRNVPVGEGPLAIASNTNLAAELAALNYQTPSKNRIIAHRAGALERVENTLDSCKEVFGLGFKHLDVDAYLLADGSVGLFHDATLDALTTSTGNVQDLTREQFKALSIDAGTWRARSDGMQVRPTMLDEFLKEFKSTNAILWIEGKNTQACDAIVALLLNAGWPRERAVIQSFTLSELGSATRAGYETCFLANSWASGFSAYAGITWAGGSSAAWSSAAVVNQAKTAGMKTAVWTLSRRHQLDLYAAMGIDMFWSDTPAYMSDVVPISEKEDLFKMSTFGPGMLASNTNGSYARGVFSSGGYFGWPDVNIAYRGVLQGYACPILGNINATSFKLNFALNFSAVSNDSRWFSVHCCANTDAAFADAPSNINGYHCLVRQNALNIYKTNTDGATLLTTTGMSVLNLDQDYQIELTVTPTAITLAIPALAVSITANDGEYRGGYFTMGCSAAAIKVRNLIISPL